MSHKLKVALSATTEITCKGAIELLEGPNYRWEVTLVERRHAVSLGGEIHSSRDAVAEEIDLGNR
jgi:hypothetical protein